MSRKMKIALHVPCYINELNPEIAKKTLLILRKLKLNVFVPREQTCCGQIFVNSGKDTKLKYRFNEIFKDFDYIVSPSSSCVYNVKKYGLEVSKKIFELGEFLYDVMNLRDLAKDYPKKIALHNSCHSVRGLKEVTPSENNLPYKNKIKELLGDVIEGRDECCGFGGVYSLKEGYLSYVMGRDKLDDLISKGAEVITGVDYSCLMHLDSIAKKDNDNIQIKHISEIIWECLC